MCRLLRSLLVSLAVTDGVIPYPSRMCQHYSQPWENHLLSHQLEQCIDSQSYRPSTRCLHDHVLYVQGPGRQKCFQPRPRPDCRCLSPTRGSKPQVASRHHVIITMPPCLHLPPNATQMLQPRTGVCLPNGRTSWTGTIMQTNEITDQLCSKKSGSAAGSVTRSQSSPPRLPSVPASRRNSSHC